MTDYSEFYDELNRRNTITEKLDYIAETVGSTGPEREFVTIDSILASFLKIREDNALLWEDRNEAWRNTTKESVKFFEENKSLFFISYEKLATMTLKEIAECL